MNSDIRISNVRLFPCSWRDLQTGLIGFVMFQINSVFRVDGVTLRRTRDGRLCLSYPVAKFTSQAEYNVIRPVNDEARREIERQVFQALDLLETVD